MPSICSSSSAITTASHQCLLTQHLASWPLHMNCWYSPLPLHLCVQDVTPHLTAEGKLQYVTVHLKVSKTDPFGQGIDVIIELFWYPNLWGLYSLGPHPGTLCQSGPSNSAHSFSCSDRHCHEA